ncbi:hypothetical protein QUB80_04150 [Chlorogloeopsis sp. ULAP01]|uniref:hypothetical protein n=1 Tax=Chlorogloeopsis sp. ULAP01 TaxID=3056483 RepID=UPI0025AA479D|nr:hypothetical protein [Chlorogloeopsis sp. ULAP01]MDM9379890.1 hypothetical protein [Chlorogloeopsis sp. ULAP01]
MLKKSLAFGLLAAGMMIAPGAAMAAILVDKLLCKESVNSVKLLLIALLLTMQS